MRLIDADALIKSIQDWYCKNCDHYNYVRCRACGTDDAINMIDEAPTVATDMPEPPKEVTGDD